MGQRTRIRILFIATGTICLVLSMFLFSTKHADSVAAVGVLCVNPVGIKQNPGSAVPYVWSIWVLLTNRTSKALSVSFPRVEARAGKQWTNYCDPFDPRRKYATAIEPHSTVVAQV